MQNNKPCILVADDEKEIREVLCLLLSGEGCEVITACDGKEALELAGDHVDLYILDVNMPQLNGFMAGAEIRKQFDAPIMFLTAYSGESDKVMGFSVGADDYLVKPFSNIELLMRVKAILRRGRIRTEAPRENTGLDQLEDLTIDRNRQTVSRNGVPINLTYTEYKILALLVENRKKIFSLDNIYQSVWDENAVSDSAVMMHIKNLRKKLGDHSRQPKYIKTAWGRGYYVD